MSHDHGQVCRCRATHKPPPLELEEHHIWPLGMGGPDLPENRVWLCPTAHTNVHEILRELLKVGPLTWGEALAIWPGLNRYQLRLALEGLARFHAGTTRPADGPLELPLP